MMGTRYTGYFISFLLHGVVAAAVMIVPFNEIRRHGAVAIDFNIIPGSQYLTTDDSRRNNSNYVKKRNNTSFSGTSKTARTNSGEGNINNEGPVSNNEGHISREPQGLAAGAEDSTVHRNTSSSLSSGSATGDIKTLNYGRPGGADERQFSFIRETIIQGIVYPERARRMGWEGKVVLSFVVRENGVVDNVKVITSSGFSILDENARDTVAKTNLKRKVPVRLYVLLPIEYRLHEKKQ